ncbi:MAG: protein kinase [Planctomycetota bacterium]
MPDDPHPDPHPPADSERSGASDAEAVAVQRIAHYRIEGIAARGGESVVYRATDETLDRTVALKVIADDAYADRLIAEARNTSKLAHPGIAAVYQAGRDEETGVAFVAFEWVEGSTLREHLRAEPSPREVLLRWVEKIASAVAYAHESGLVHGDLKADNVVLTVGDGRVKLIDFGLSTSVEELGDDEIWGTPAYMAPELFDGAPRSISTDLFALGALCYELATGTLPFGGEDGDEAKVIAVQAEPASDPRDRVPELPMGLVQIIGSLLSLDPAERGPTAAEVARWAKHARRPERGRRARWLPVVLLLFVAAGGWFTRDRWWPSAPANSHDASTPSGASEEAPILREEVLVIGAWSGPDGGEDETQFLVDLMQMQTHGADPGSSLLGMREEPNPEAVLSTIEGVWVRRDGRYVATIEWDSLVESPEEFSTIEAGSPVELAEAIAKAAFDLEREWTRLLSVPASTLTSDAEALKMFIHGVRRAEAGDLTAARTAFASARQRAGRFPEAAAWEAAVQVAGGDLEVAIDTAILLRDVPTRLASVLGDTLATPVRNRYARWGASHELAQRFDLTLDALDLATGDLDLLERLDPKRSGGNVALLLTDLRLSVRHGRVDRARSALERFRTSPSSSDAWQRTFYEWRLDPKNAEDRLPSARWMLRRRPPHDFLQMAFFLADGDLDSAMHRAEEPVSALAGQVTATTVLAAGGQFEAALELAGRLSTPLDRGLGERLRAGVHWIAGDRDAAVASLNHARDHDPNHPKTVFLFGYVGGDPYGVEPLGSQVVSEFSRWHHRYAAVGAARRADDPAVALELLNGVGWVDAELQAIDWPELGYLAWIERARARAGQGDRDGARDALRTLREWWPKDRAPKSRVSDQIRQLEVEIDGPQ